MTSNQPTLAIIIPIYGHPSLLIDAIESALRQQTTHEYRIVLVNDGCPSPQSDQVCRQYAHVHPQRILYIKKRNGGLSSARNRGIQIALETWPSVKAIYLLDADNRLHPHMLERSFALLEAHHDAGWIFPDIHMFGSTRSYCDTTGEFSRLQMLQGNFCEAGSMVRREVFEAGVSYDEAMKLGYEDWEFWLQGVAAGFKGRHGPALGFRYRKRPESMLANSERDHHQITGYMRRKHANLYTLKRAFAHEQEEMPRFALYLADCDEFILTSDLNDLSRRQTWEEFARAMRRHVACGHLQAVPQTLVFTTPQVLGLLEKRGLAANILWTLEADLEKRHVAFLNLEQRMGIDVRLELSKPFTPLQKDRRAAVLGAISTRLLDACLSDPNPAFLASICEDVSQVSATSRRLQIEHLERPVVLEAAAAASLCDLVAKRGPAYRAVRPMTVNPRRLFFRPPWDASYISQQLFKAPAPPPLHMDPRERNLAFLVPVAEFGGVERVTCNLARETARQGWNVHLFVIGTGRACLLAEFKDIFTSVHLIPDDDLTSAGRLVSLLGTMDVVLNNHCIALNAALGDLKRVGVKLITQLHLVDKSRDGVLCGHPYLAADYEHSLHKLLVISKSLHHFLLAKAVPPEKLVYVPNAPSYETPPERVEAALAERAMRPADAPLRILFMARFDRQKGLDRLFDLVCESEERNAALEWRIVGKSVLQYPDCQHNVDMSRFDKYLHPPALDVHSLTRHYCWADVLILVSRYEGAPLTILEAQQLGCVPVSTNCGAVDELIVDGQTGFLLDNQADNEAIVNRTLEIFDTLQRNRDWLRQLAEQAATTRRAQSWRHTMRDLTACLDGWFPNKGAA